MMAGGIVDSGGEAQVARSVHDGELGIQLSMEDEARFFCRRQSARLWREI